MTAIRDDEFSEATWDEIGRRVVASDAGNVEHISGNAALALVRAQLDRRWDQITSGSVQCQDAFEVLDKIEDRLRSKTAAQSNG